MVPFLGVDETRASISDDLQQLLGRERLADVIVVNEFPISLFDLIGGGALFLIDTEVVRKETGEGVHGIPVFGRRSADGLGKSQALLLPLPEAGDGPREDSSAGIRLPKADLQLRVRMLGTVDEREPVEPPPEPLVVVRRLRGVIG